MGIITLGSFGCIFAATLVANAYLVIEITQPHAVIDANPILNFAEIELYAGATKLALMNSAMHFLEKSSGYPADVCNDGQVNTFPYPYNMCKSGNSNPLSQTMFITMGPYFFNKIKIYNAMGFNNPAGYDVGNRILGATLTILSDPVPSLPPQNNPKPDVWVNGSKIFTYVFTSMEPLYVIELPNLTARPTAEPTWSHAPVSNPTRRPTKSPTIMPVAAKLKSSRDTLDSAVNPVNTDDLSGFFSEGR